jgi:hypothetical protein
VLTLVLVIVNVPLRRIAPRLAFNEAELAVFFSMQMVMCAMASEWLDVIGPRIYSYAVFAERNPRYATKALPYLSEFLFFTEKDAPALKAFASGGKPWSQFIADLPLWLPKIGAWTLIVGLISLAMLCINTLFRDQWIHRERLSFPSCSCRSRLRRTAGPTPSSGAAG